MKRRKKRVISISLALVLLLNLIFVPLETEASQRNDFILAETTQECKLREGPSSQDAVVDVLPSGTLLYLTGSLTNRYNNLWFSVSILGQTRYLYSGTPESPKVKEHIHDYNMEISNDVEGSSGYVCKCGAIYSPTNGNTFTSATIAGGLLLGEQLAALGYTAAKAIALYGVLKCGQYIIPVMINRAGAIISITAEQLERERKQDSETNNKGKKIYYPSMIISNGTDTIQLKDEANPLSLYEACDYVDTLTLTEKAFEDRHDYERNVEVFHNIYTMHEKDARNLCYCIKRCYKNKIDFFGKSDGSRGYETNCKAKINGTYKHFHLHSLGKKCVIHVLFGNPLYNSQKNISYN